LKLFQVLAEILLLPAGQVSLKDNLLLVARSLTRGASSPAATASIESFESLEHLVLESTDNLSLMLIALDLLDHFLLLPLVLVQEPKGYLLMPFLKSFVVN
jgi:hypothetical protein